VCMMGAKAFEQGEGGLKIQGLQINTFFRTGHSIGCYFVSNVVNGENFDVSSALIIKMLT
jgi:hypothetical protein